MSKRLQVLLEEEEMREVRRAAARHAFPAGEIGTMLAEIDAGFDAYPGLERLSS